MTVRPFEIAVPDAVLDRIQRQVADARIGYAPADDDGSWGYGTDARYLADLVAYWRDQYDWHAQERALNRWPHFKAQIDGIDIHFQHIRGSGGGRPLMLTHGWPGSIVEFQGVIEQLAFPERFGGRAEDGFDLVIPSLPGFGWSGRPQKPIGPKGVATLWRRLMTEELGYPRFAAQGGDWGSVVTARLGGEHSDVVAAIHLNFLVGPQTDPADADANQAYWAAYQHVQATEGGYMSEQATKPQTIGLALFDNPVGTAAWVIEKFHGWGDTNGNIESRFSKDVLLTNVMSYLVNDAMLSSFWAYRSIMRERPFEGRITVPTGAALFPGEFYPMPNRANAECVYDIRHWTEMPSGGHFGALEEPALFSDDVRAFLRDYI